MYAFSGCGCLFGISFASHARGEKMGHGVHYPFADGADVAESRVSSLSFTAMLNTRQASMWRN